ncbi:hypothetical protein AC579_8968 [Pseudocercospora musae]|uniref:Uncharacterized protein n=1 Tax=Pseudocercospora musae TaxID=113226 RepID=A0A139HP09_9PEZI|nr:hypothetical protein AC579_8968 [Pseudocercospora musae]
MSQHRLEQPPQTLVSALLRTELFQKTLPTSDPICEDFFIDWTYTFHQLDLWLQQCRKSTPLNHNPPGGSNDSTPSSSSSSHLPEIPNKDYLRKLLMAEMPRPVEDGDWMAQAITRRELRGLFSHFHRQSHDEERGRATLDSIISCRIAVAKEFEDVLWSNMYNSVWNEAESGRMRVLVNGDEEGEYERAVIELVSGFIEGANSRWAGMEADKGKREKRKRRHRDEEVVRERSRGPDEEKLEPASSAQCKREKGKRRHRDEEIVRERIRGPDEEKLEPASSTQSLQNDIQQNGDENDGGTWENWLRERRDDLLPGLFFIPMNYSLTHRATE